MSPNFLVRVLPRVLKAAVVFCPAVVNVSDVFLYLMNTPQKVHFKFHTFMHWTQTKAYINMLLIHPHKHA